MTNHKALLTIYDLNKMSTKEVNEIKKWLSRVVKDINNKQYGKVAKFRLMKPYEIYKGNVRGSA